MEASRKEKFASRYRVTLLHHLGPEAGQQNAVFQSDRMTAVKFFDRPSRFARELEVYRILLASGTRSIAGHNVPQLILADEELLVMELSIVQRPFVLDFEGAMKPEEVPDFEPLTIEEHYERLRELFGDRWTDALHVAEMFRVATGFTQRLRTWNARLGILQ